MSLARHAERAPARVVGGTPAMRARARTDPGRHGRRRDHRGAVRPAAGILRAIPSRRRPDLALDHGGGERQPVSSGTLRSQLAADGPLWQASVFDNAYLTSQPAGEPRVRGTSEALSVAGRVQPFSSETGPADPYVGAGRAGLRRPGGDRPRGGARAVPGRLDLPDAPQPPGGNRRRARRAAGVVRAPLRRLLRRRLRSVDRPARRPPVAGRRCVRVPRRRRVGRHLDEPALAVPEPLRPGLADDPGDLPQAPPRLPGLF